MKINLYRSRQKALSALSANFSEVFLASLVLPVFTGSVGNYGLQLLVFGLIGTLISGFLSVKFAEKGRL